MTEGEHTAEHAVIRADAVFEPHGSHDEQVYRPEVVGDEQNLALETGALAALGFAVASFIVLPVIGAVIALLLAPGAKRRIRQSDGAHVGYGFAQAAQIVAVVNLVIAAVVVGVVIALVNWVFDGVGDWVTQMQEWNSDPRPFADLGS